MKVAFSQSERVYLEICFGVTTHLYILIVLSTLLLIHSHIDGCPFDYNSLQDI